MNKLVDLFVVFELVPDLLFLSVAFLYVGNVQFQSRDRCLQVGFLFSQLVHFVFFLNNQVDLRNQTVFFLEQIIHLVEILHVIDFRPRALLGKTSFLLKISQV